MDLDELLPEYDVSDEVAVTVAASPAATFAALEAIDLIELGRNRPMIGMLGAMRLLPEVVSHLVHGEPLPSAPDHVRLRDTATEPAMEGGWTLLVDEPGEEIVLGLVGRFWRPVIEYREVPAEGFRTFDEPGWAKTVYALSVAPLPGDRTLLRGVMRTATTDEHARRWFRRYWTFGVGPGAHLLVRGLLEEARLQAERVAVPA
ncbi:MAG: hypothetical protein JHC95_03590 [Solirubrobacteraceae bacterium]|nr:hypothetical protein [Solirubrobacteraceae bacterium]